ncbi:Aste57867_2495 [Aphanomyces stellatus]|uniref:Aste57867_2495 protein n=1 Tax=Aphanomyces stellatus TaxID=120398 RepID=A0A485KDD3_9STRA|nr:hypothetical protein As57867_002488 [Aphanomyces stellatus]VFT79694.1 Aste57867_2495 [Aphanomyces stellatus]
MRRTARNGHDQVRETKDDGTLTAGRFIDSGATRDAYSCCVQKGCVAGYTEGSYVVYKKFKAEYAARGYAATAAASAMHQYKLELAQIFNDEVRATNEGSLCPVIVRDAYNQVRR